MEGVEKELADNLRKKQIFYLEFMSGKKTKTSYSQALNLTKKERFERKCVLEKGGIVTILKKVKTQEFWKTI